MLGWLAIALSCLGAHGAHADGAVRAGSHPGYGRIVFEWLTPVAVSAEADGRRLALRFAEPLDADVSDIVRRLPDYAVRAELAPDRRSASIALKRPVELKISSNGTRTIVDLFPAASAPGAAELSVTKDSRAPVVREEAAAEPDSADARVANKTQPDRPQASARAAPLPPTRLVPVDAKPVDARPVDATPVMRGLAASGVQVRWGAHGAFDRLVIEGPGLAGTRVVRIGGTVVIELGSAGISDISAFKPGAMARLRRLERSGQELRAFVAEGITFEQRREGEKLIIDFAAGPDVRAAAIVASLAPAAGDPKAAPAKSEIAKSEIAKSETAKSEIAKSESASKPPSAQSPSTQSPSAQSPSTQSAAPARLAASPASPASAPSLPATARQATASEQAATSAPLRNGREAAARDEAKAPDMAGFTLERERDTVRIRATAQGGMAAFYRAGALWLVFAEMPPADLAALEKALKGLAGSAARVAGAGGAAIRIAGADTLQAQLRRESGVWHIELSKNRAPPPLAVMTDANPRPVDGGMLFAASGMGGIVEFKDPEVGDRLLVALAVEAGYGHPGERELAQFKILSSRQGLALVPFGDALVAARAEGGLLLAGMGEGAAPSAPAIAIAAIVTGEKRLFDFPGWRRADLGDTVSGTKALRRAAAMAKPEPRNAARLDLAHFLFARGLPHDALAALETMVREAPALAEMPDIRALRGVLRLLVHQHDEARKELAAPALDASREAALWRALLAARTGDTATAMRGFTHGVSLLPGYPQPYKSHLALAAAEAALDEGEGHQVGAYLDTLKNETLSPSERMSVQVFRGRALASTERAEDGMRLLQRARRNGDPKNVARAALAQVEAGLATGNLAREDAIAELEAARYAWRGDATELAILRRLATLHFEAGQTRKGLVALKTAATYFPAHREAPAIARDMGEAFARAFLDGFADKMPLVSALALYNDFSELSPSGAKGEDIVRRLGQRLVQLDLLDQAAALFERQLAGRVVGEARARMGAELAAIRLADEKPQAALRALDTSGGAELSSELARRRTDLRARALAGLGRFEEATALLRTDDATQAQLRADLLWTGKQWPALSVSCRAVNASAQAKEDGLTKDEEQGLMRCAIAMSLAGDEAGLAAVRGKFGVALSKGAMKDAFLAVSAKPSAPDLIVLAAQLGDMKAFKALAQKAAP